VVLFEGGEGRWIERLGNLRNLIRQEVIARQLAEHVVDGMRVLDVGCGQGSQALRLAARGCRVTGVDPSPPLLQLFSDEAAAAGVDVELIEGRIEDVDRLLVGREFDLVCSHGLFMYLDDRQRALKSLAARLGPKGRLSVTFRNAHALAMRPGLRRDWAGALALFDSTDYINELGLRATADRIDDVEHDLADCELRMECWYGVRVFNDAIAPQMTAPDDENIEALFDAEERAGRTDPYRWVAGLLHVIADRTGKGG
jgi:S-adenosylmethionine-dependent methyltransferase